MDLDKLGKASFTAGVAIVGGTAEAAPRIAVEDARVAWNLPMGASRNSISDDDEQLKILLHTVNRAIEDIQTRHRPVLLVIDGLDRIREIERVRELFVESDALARLACRVVICGPFTLRHHSTLRAVSRFQFLSLVNEPVLDQHDPGRPGPGRPFFTDLFLRRTQDLGGPTLIFPATLRAEADSGGAMRTPFDELGKQIGQSALGRLGATVAQHPISPETQHADLRYEPDPVRVAERGRLGLLGRLASGPCLIELYARAPTSAEFRACLGKHIAYWHARELGTLEPPPPPSVAGVPPFLWIIAAGTPSSLVADLGLAPALGWPSGVYVLGPKVLRVGLVAANKLPRERSTLLVRLMAAGPLLSQAIVELSALPAEAHEHTVADQILLRLHDALGLKPDRTPEEQEFLVTMYSTWADAREMGRKEGQEQGREQGQRQARAGDVLTVLRVRGIPVSDAERERVLAEADPDRLERWLERAVAAASVAAVLDEPS